MTIDALLKKWVGKEKAGERAEYQQFLVELCQALGVPTPGDDGAPAADYRFEAPASSEAVFGRKTTKRIDLYRRDHFILEAKQSQPGAAGARDGAADGAAAVEPTETVYDLFGQPIGVAPSTTRPKRRYDRLMDDARLQAQRYALALPEAHATPPFIIVADIGQGFELYHDAAGNGRGFRPFPNERAYRIALGDLRSDAPVPDVEVDGRGLTAAEMLRAIWTDPRSIDPRTRAARVTRDIAKLLSRVATQLEQDQSADVRANEVGLGERIEGTSLFLMRTLFCMFAEDMELLPRDSFKTFLADAETRSDQFWRRGLADLWSRMNDPQEVNRYWSFGDAVVRYFNGNLFADARVFDLPAEAKNILRIAAGQNWRAVEPAIFGTLLEQVLTPADRAKLGAHYTPRPYVERLVQATMTDVLLPEWEAARDAARAMLDPPLPGREGSGGGRPSEGARASRETHPQPLPFREGRTEEALALVTAFHKRLVAVRVLDPACGTGNFLYVAMEALLALEAEVRRFVEALGGELAPAVEPNQFLGLELNPRAAVIAELVLWIGWLRFRLANTPEAIGEPVLPPLRNINEGSHGGFDAVLVRTATGEPDLANPRRPAWPAADFIIGNPPFIGGKDLRDRLGSDYAEALWAANPRVPKSADLVMHWWDRAADLLCAPGTRLRRFGFVTTNSITQVFSRRVIEGWLASPLPAREGLGVGGERSEPVADARVATADESFGRADARTHPQPLPASREGSAEGKLHLVLAIPDHPWTRVTRDAAAVRIAMTVAAAGPGEGRLVEIVQEAGLDTDEPALEERAARGRINADLSVGTDVTRVVPLKANEGISFRGVTLIGQGFVVNRRQLEKLGLSKRPGLDAHIREYRNGRDVTSRPRGVLVLDFFGLTEQQVLERYPEAYQHLLTTVRPFRQGSNRATYRDRWWVFGEPRGEQRPALVGLERYIATSQTSSQRTFAFLDISILPDQQLIAIATDDAFLLGVLSSSLHALWCLQLGGWLGVGNDNRYNNSRVFDPFPFPDRSDAVAAIADRLDAARRAALAEDERLTMTGLYNLVAAIRDRTLPPEREAAATRARAFIVAKLHDDLDAAVADAYGWGGEWARAPLPPAEIVRRLVSLNAERAAEEAAGRVRWLRPEYQADRFGKVGTDAEARGGAGRRKKRDPGSSPG